MSKQVFQTVILLCVLFLLPSSIGAQGNNPSPEAIAACENQNEGAICEFTPQSGDIVNGTCQIVQDTLTCIPQRIIYLPVILAAPDSSSATATSTTAPGEDTPTATSTTAPENTLTPTSTTVPGEDTPTATSTTAPGEDTPTATSTTAPSEDTPTATSTTAPGEDTPTATSTTAPTDTATPTPTATSTPNTQNYSIVDTNQSNCYDNSTEISCPTESQSFYGQDAQHNGNQPSYTDNGDETVTDNITGLMWQKSPDINDDGEINTNDKLNYSDATSYCDDLVLAGYSDWELPDVKELYSLMDFRGTDPPASSDNIDVSNLTPFIDTDYFEFGYGDTDAGQRIIDAQFASSTLYVGEVMNNQQAMFGVNVADGRIKGYGVDLEFYVRCVRQAATYGQNDFNDNGDGTINDYATNLMWAQDDNGEGVNWEDALAWVETQNEANYLGYNDWRLPNAKELQSLVDYTRSPDTTNSAAIDPLFNTTSIVNEGNEEDYPFFWTGTTHLRFDGSATNGVYVAFGRGLGSIDGETVIDVHGAGCQRSDPKDGNEENYPSWGNGPQGDVQRVFNYVRLVRDID